MIIEFAVSLPAKERYMFEFIEGKVDSITPSSVVLNVGGVGFLIEISLTTFAEIKDKANVRLLVHYVVRDDAQLLFGFFTSRERQVFRSLISVNGIGVNIARMMLSSMNPSEIVQAIVNEEANTLKTIKGIGPKTAQRVILELKDGLSKLDIDFGDSRKDISNKNKAEALLALQTLGLNKLVVERTLNKLIESDPQQDVETLIKKTLKTL